LTAIANRLVDAILDTALVGARSAGLKQQRELSSTPLVLIKGLAVLGLAARVLASLRAAPRCP
jgi:hypothetical protein